MPDRGVFLTAYPWLSKVLFDICTESPGDMYITLKIFLSSILQAQNVFCAHTADARRWGNVPGTWAPTAARTPFGCVGHCLPMNPLCTEARWDLSEVRKEPLCLRLCPLHHLTPNLLVLPWFIELLTKLLSSFFICSFLWMWLKRIHLRHKEQLGDLKQAL